MLKSFAFASGAFLVRIDFEVLFRPLDHLFVLKFSLDVSASCFYAVFYRSYFRPLWSHVISLNFAIALTTPVSVFIVACGVGSGH